MPGGGRGEGADAEETTTTLASPYSMETSAKQNIGPDHELKAQQQQQQQVKGTQIHLIKNTHTQPHTYASLSVCCGNARGPLL